MDSWADLHYHIDIPILIKAIGTCENVLIVDECRKTGCHGEGLLAQLVSESKKELKKSSKYNNKKNIKVSILEINKNLERMAKNA